MSAVLTPPGDRLAHLTGPGAAVRQAIAAHYLRECRAIVEIGGAGLPITNFLTHAPDSVTVIDPKIEAYSADALGGRPCRVRHIAAKYQAARFDFGSGPLGVALLGLSLKPYGERDALQEELIALLRGASLAVIESSTTRDRAVEQFPRLIAAARLRTEVEIDLRIVDGVMNAAGHGDRRLLVLRPE